MANRDFDRLCESLREYEGRLALIGTGKNAGKTTVLNFLLQLLPASTTASSSVGRDGEEYDLVEKHPKPRIHLGQGALFATARGSLERCSGSWSLEAETDCQTPLGPVVIARARGNCRVELAGPSGTDQMLEISDRMQALGASRVLIDGAFDRIASSASRLSQAVIVAAGSGGRPSAEETARQTRSLVRRFQLPVGQSGAENEQSVTAAIRLRSLSSDLLPELTGRSVLLPDPSCCLIDESDWRWIDSGKVEVFVERQVPLLAVFTNPFRPHLVPLPAQELLERSRTLCPGVAIFDLKLEGVLSP